MDGSARSAFPTGLRTTPRDELLDLSRAYVLARAIHVAAELGVADHVDANPVTAGEIARLTGARAPQLERLLRFLSGHRIFAEARPGAFVATPMSNVLKTDAPDSLRPALRMVNAAWWAAVGHLDHAVKTGESAFADLHGQPFFTWLKEHGDAQERFDAGMANTSRTSDEAIARAYDFSRAPVVVDVGGGRGGLLRAILERHPSVRGVLFEQTQVVAAVRAPAAASIAARFEARAGDVFERVPDGGRIYVIKGVLHDFDDEKALVALRNCRRALADDGRLLVIERLLAGDDRPHQAKTIDVLMMALLGGRERALAEWEHLFESAGVGPPTRIQ
ncbi:MAG TPA: methyltransferase, partial [Minicystis sp.]|nr:methyltransferase [Minicystis sp.]